MLNFIIGFLTIPLVWLLAVLFSIVAPAVRDTAKWRFRHVKPGYPKAILFVSYPAIFWTELKDQAHAWRHGYRHVSSPARL